MEKRKIVFVVELESSEKVTALKLRLFGSLEKEGTDTDVYQFQYNVIDPPKE